MPKSSRKRDSALHCSPLIALLAQHRSGLLAPGVHALADALRVRFGEAVAAILVYGSCFRTGTDEGLVDLYVVVDRYRNLPGTLFLRLLYRILPPTVFYLEIPLGNRRVRAKYAVISQADFRRGTSSRWFHSYLWARFAQPSNLLYARDEEIAQQIHAARSRAIVTFVTRVLPVIPAAFDAELLWREGLSRTYRTELRPERLGAVARLVQDNLGYYEQVTRTAMSSIPFDIRVREEGPPMRYESAIPERVRFWGGLAWSLRKALGKTLNVLRLLKGLMTFQGGMDYVLWKIERHSGMRPVLSPRLQRHRWLALGLMLWKLYRKGGYR
ncbi:MAG: hypothetical protein HXY51_02355 [Nitrospirae bacterium]|nr:hypothetical protein [Nitrospirota bacterium]